MVLVTANGIALQLAGSKAGMSDEQYTSMHTPLTYMIGHSEAGKQAQKYAAPFALIVASFTWLAQVANAYREKHPPRPKTNIVTPNPETKSFVYHSEAENGGVEPAISENGMKPEDLAAAASIMGL